MSKKSLRGIQNETTRASDNNADKIRRIEMELGKLRQQQSGTEVETAINTGAIGITIDGVGAELTTGLKGFITIPYNCTISSCTLLADQVGSIVIDIYKCAYNDYIPSTATSITAAAKPTITNGIKSQDVVLIGWVKNITAGDIIRFNIDSVTDITKCTLVLKVLK